MGVGSQTLIKPGVDTAALHLVINIHPSFQVLQMMGVPPQMPGMMGPSPGGMGPMPPGMNPILMGPSPPENGNAAAAAMDIDPTDEKSVEYEKRQVAIRLLQTSKLK